MILAEYDEKLHIANERELGRIEGKAEGTNGKLISLVCRKLKKNIPVNVIAAELEETIDVIQKIYTIAVNYAPDYDEEKILAEYMLSEKRSMQ